MDFNGQKVLPAIKRMKDFEKVLSNNDEYMVMLDLHIAQLGAVMSHVRKAGKKVILHADMIQGLRNDKYSTEFLCQQIKPAGLISTRGDVLRTAKKNNVMAIQRLFLLDTIALETSYKLVEQIEPDFIEVLPGVIPQYIEKVRKDTKTEVITGGLIETKEDVLRAFEAGARAITTSREDLWKFNSMN
ncbi:glycerol-3-phosphate responsive antiterminator GlpP [Bacillus sp. LL01]|uniref:glycerol-3-phosphate responsive antiterminator n=1 Tax=Bacillus sp. LL01 TaxID=1665556 RepID=UPI00064D1FD8|nr:glycerol-3-phosphate responsive antiterminator [Bacillus sp. LL01]KMJ55956.1 glycerol-3-phosphate responsive antiterminator GlpP [Bacillus sp. LL01]